MRQNSSAPISRLAPERLKVPPSSCNSDATAGWSGADAVVVGRAHHSQNATTPPGRIRSAMRGEDVAVDIHADDRTFGTDELTDEEAHVADATANVQHVHAG
jgi:hypothetical protein